MFNQIVRTLFSFLFLFSLSITVQAQKTPEYVFPTTPFDEVATTKLLDEGTNTIRGKAWVIRKKKNFFPDKGDKILLYPVTPYITEFIELRTKNTKKKQAAMSKDAFIYRIEGKFTDYEGSFEFSNIRPGKYYVVTWINYEKTKTVSLQTGTGYSLSFNVFGGSMTPYPIMKDFLYTYDVEAEVNDIIEVTGDKQIIPVTVSVKKK